MIETVNFAYRTDDKHFAEIKEWLDDNAKEYFDSVTVSTAGTGLICYSGSIPVMNFARSSSGVHQHTIFTLATGEYYRIPGTGYIIHIKQIIKTNYGLSFSMSNQNNTVPHSIFITKTNKGGLAVVFDTEQMIYNTGSIACVSIMNSVGFKPNLYKLEQYYGTNSGRLTTLCPFICKDVEEYTPHLFLTTYSQSLGTPCTLDIEGKKYSYNGYIALED